MAFGIKREELVSWKKEIKKGKICFLTHYWVHPVYPQYTTVTKVGCCDVEKLKKWGEQYGLNERWIHYTPYPHYDLLGDRQLDILSKEGMDEQIERFHLR